MFETQRDEMQQIVRKRALERTRGGGSEVGGAPNLPYIDPARAPQHLFLNGIHAADTVCPACKDAKAQQEEAEKNGK